MEPGQLCDLGVIRRRPGWGGGPAGPERQAGLGRTVRMSKTAEVAAASLPGARGRPVVCVLVVLQPKGSGSARPSDPFLLSSQVQAAPWQPPPEMLRLPSLRCLSLTGLPLPALAAAQLLW